RFRRTLSANDRTPLAAAPTRHTAWILAPVPANAASGWRLSLPRCNAFVFSSRVLSVILTAERSLHFQPRRNNPFGARGNPRILPLRGRYRPRDPRTPSAGRHSQT